MVFRLNKPNVEKLETRKDVKSLTKLLDYKEDDSIPQKAVEALGNLGIHDQDATDSLKEALKAPNLNLDASKKLKEIARRNGFKWRMANLGSRAVCDGCGAIIKYDMFLCKPRLTASFSRPIKIPASSPDLLCERCYDKHQPEPLTYICYLQSLQREINLLVKKGH